MPVYTAQTLFLISILKNSLLSLSLSLSLLFPFRYVTFRLVTLRYSLRYSFYFSVTLSRNVTQLFRWDTLFPLRYVWGTNFARIKHLILAVSVVEDIMIWGVSPEFEGRFCFSYVSVNFSWLPFVCSLIMYTRMKNRI
jgi:hypothetical protein